MNDMFKDVKKFHETYGQPAPMLPQALPEDRKQLRLGLIAEELQELEEALDNNDAVETYDAAIDILYVTMGLLVEMGLDPQGGWDEVQSSNMSKLGADGQPIKSRGMALDGYPEGKVLKGPNYFKPNLKLVLKDMGLGLDIHESHNVKDEYSFRTARVKTIHCGDCWAAVDTIRNGVLLLEAPCTALPGNKEIKR